MSKGVIVVGSLNVDHVLHLPRFPQPGETLHSSSYSLGPGGKGFNQCVAVRRMLKSQFPVTMYGRIGLDEPGKMLQKTLQAEKITDNLVKVQALKTGAAFVTVDANGQNHIVLHGGANMSLSPDQIDNSILQDASAVIMQFEIPLETLMAVATLAVATATKVIMNPSPCQTIPSGLIDSCDYLICNETEAAQLTGQGKQSAWSRATKLLDMGVRSAVIVTQGAEATVAVYRDNGSQRVIEVKPPSIPKCSDTTGAGDAFIGAFVSRMVETDFKAPLEDAIRFANYAGALTTTRHGASSSIPTKSEVENYMSS